MIDDEDAYALLRSRDRRFDGSIFVAVATTGVYCRPSCPAVMPKRENVRFYPSSAAAQEAGFRACKRCRPDAAPGSPEWNVRADVVGRAMRLIADGLVDREGVAGLAAHLGYSERQLHRQLIAELGAGPQGLARAQRAQTARTLLETTDLPASEVAFAAGFTSIRQFNDSLKKIFGLTPTQLRALSTTRDDALTPGMISLRLAYRQPMDMAGLFHFLAQRAVPGIEEGGGDFYRRSLDLPYGSGVVTLRDSAKAGYVRCRLGLEDLRDLPAAVQRCRRLLDLDLNPWEIVDLLGADPLLAPLVAAVPGRRVPGHVDAAELAVRAVLGQQIGIGAARTRAGRLVERFGRPLTTAVGSVTHTFPRMGVLAALDPAALAMLHTRQRAVVALAGEVEAGTVSLDAGADRDSVEQRFLAVPGISPWTAAYIRMRALGDPDVFLPTDLRVQSALRQLGQTATPKTARRWRPWRSYVVQHLWAVLDEPVPQ